MPERKHHFLSVSYLAGFTETGGVDGRLHVIPREGGPRTARPKAIAYERGLYTLEEVKGVDPEGLEALLAVGEGELAPVLRQVDEDRRLPDVGSDAYSVLISSIAMFAVRTPAARRGIKGAREQAHVFVARQRVATPEAWAAFRREAERAGAPPAALAIDYERMRDFVMNRMRAEASSDTVHHDMMMFQDRLFRSGFSRRRWGLVVAPADGPFFVTSDSPVTLAGQDIRMGYEDPRSEVGFALTRNVAVVGVFPGHALPQMSPATAVAHLNSATVALCDRYALSPTEDFAWLRRDGRVGHRPELAELFKHYPRRSGRDLDARV